MKNRSISIGCDHAGFKHKKHLVEFLRKLGHVVRDFGCENESSVDYPDFAHLVATAVSKNKSDLGILLCGSGNGINMTANKYSQIRSALCWNVEIAKLARQHNNANILAMPSRYITLQEAEDMTKIFIETDFEGGRHQSRIDKIGKHVEC